MTQLEDNLLGPKSLSFHPCLLPKLQIPHISPGLVLGGKLKGGVRGGFGPRVERLGGSGVSSDRSIRALMSVDGGLGVGNRVEITLFIKISYNLRCNRFPSSYPSCAIKCPRALKTVCGRLEIVDRRDYQALISAAGAPSSPPPLSLNDDRVPGGQRHNRAEPPRCGRVCGRGVWGACCICRKSGSRQRRANGLTLTAVLADAEFGDVTAFRVALHRLRLPYAVGILSHLTVFATRPRLVRPISTPRGRPRTRWRMVRPIVPIAAISVASSHVAQRGIAPTPGPLHRRACHARSRVVPWSARTRDLAALREGGGTHTPTEVLPRQSAGVGFVAGACPIGASALVHRAAVPRTQERARPRSFRRTHLAWLATPRRLDGCGPRVHPTRADAPWRRRPNISGRARHRARNPYRLAVCGETTLHALDESGET